MPAVYIKNIEKYKEKISSEFDDVNLFKQGQRNIAGFMKHLLVRRFESSIDAFYKSLGFNDSLLEYVKEWYERLGKFQFIRKVIYLLLKNFLKLKAKKLKLTLKE